MDKGAWRATIHGSQRVRHNGATNASLTFHTTALLPISMHLKNDLTLVRVPLPPPPPPQGERNMSARAPKTPQDSALQTSQDSAQCLGWRQARSSLDACVLPSWCLLECHL